MRTQLLGRLLLSLVLVATAGGLIGFQWNETHVFNPGWQPHARFHAVQLVWLGTVYRQSGSGWCGGVLLSQLAMHWSLRPSQSFFGRVSCLPVWCLARIQVPISRIHRSCFD